MLYKWFPKDLKRFFKIEEAPKKKRRRYFYHLLANLIDWFRKNLKKLFLNRVKGKKMKKNSKIFIYLFL